MSPINVLLVDDSAVVRQVLQNMLQTDPGIKVLGAVADPLFALRRMETQWPDVIVLDIEMPRMDGITFLKKIMAERPTPVVICSTLTEKGAEATLQALSAGAISIVTKPRMGVKRFLEDSCADIVQAVKTAARANLGGLQRSRSQSAPRLTADAMLPSAGRSIGRTTEHVVAIGTSTGGTQALEKVLRVLPRVTPGMVIVQHMPEKFTALFAERLNGLCEINVKEAEDGDRVLPGQALIAPGDRHMLLKRSGAQYIVEVKDGPLVSRHRPSVDVLFRSVAREAGPNALGIIMTGMGDDGATGMREMHDAGANTIAQDESSCVVFGMPKEAIKKGGVNDVIHLDDIAQRILEFGQGKSLLAGF